MLNLNQVPEINGYIKEFLELYAKRPSVRNLMGLEYEGSLVLWHVLKQLPKVSAIIESGVATGMSSWLIETTRPNCHLVHLEPRLEAIKYKTKGQYLSTDFMRCTSRDLGLREDDSVLAFFDDHQDILPRLERCLELGIEHTLWDDNWDGICSDHMSQRLYYKFYLAEDIKARWDKVKVKFAETFEFSHVGDLKLKTQPYNHHENLTYIRLGM